MTTEVIYTYRHLQLSNNCNDYIKQISLCKFRKEQY